MASFRQPRHHIQTVVGNAKMKGLTIILTLLTFQTFGQDALDLPDTNWTDTTYKPIVLQSITTDKGVIEYDYGKNAIIYLSYPDFTELCSKRTKQNWRGKEYKTLLDRLDSIASTTDTIKLYDYNTELDYLTSDLIKKGQGQVYDKINKHFVDTITHRLEKYGAQAHRFYYLPDKRAFFAVMELSGILEHDKDQIQALGEHYNNYLKLYDRLREIGK